jgi:FkbM family methyltransferase
MFPSVTISLKRVFKGTPVEGVVRKLRRFRRIADPAFTIVEAENKGIERIIDQTLELGDNAIDVGCHMGEILARILKRSPYGTHHAFEPIPSQAKWLKKKFPKAKVHEIAVSDYQGEAEFLHNVDNPAYSSLKDKSGPGNRKKIRVRVDTLDNVVGTDRVLKFLKVDVEGGELGVFRGALQLVKKNKPIVVFEFTKHASAAFGTSPADVYDFLTNEATLKVYSISGYLKGDAPLSREEFLDFADQYKGYNFVAA